MLPDTFTLNGRTLSRTDLAGLVRIVLDDASSTPSQGRPIFLRVLGGPDQYLDGVPDAHDWIERRDPREPEQYLLVIDHNVTDVTYDTPARMLAEIASLIQDYVVDTTGSPWPQHHIGDRTVVLEAAAIDSEAWWCDRGHPVRRVGELNNH